MSAFLWHTARRNLADHDVEDYLQQDLDELVPACVLRTNYGDWGYMQDLWWKKSLIKYRLKNPGVNDRRKR